MTKDIPSWISDNLTYLLRFSASHRSFLAGVCLGSLLLVVMLHTAGGRLKILAVLCLSFISLVALVAHWIEPALIIEKVGWFSTHETNRHQKKVVEAVRFTLVFLVMVIAALFTY